MRSCRCTPPDCGRQHDPPGQCSCPVQSALHIASTWCTGLQHGGPPAAQAPAIPLQPLLSPEAPYGAVLLPLSSLAAPLAAPTPWASPSQTVYAGGAQHPLRTASCVACAEAPTASCCRHVLQSIRVRRQSAGRILHHLQEVIGMPASLSGQPTRQIWAASSSANTGRCTGRGPGPRCCAGDLGRRRLTAAALAPSVSAAAADSIEAAVDLLLDLFAQVPAQACMVA